MTKIRDWQTNPLHNYFNASGVGEILRKEHPKFLEELTLRVRICVGGGGTAFLGSIEHTLKFVGSACLYGARKCAVFIHLASKKHNENWPQLSQVGFHALMVLKMLAATPLCIGGLLFPRYVIRSLQGLAIVPKNMSSPAQGYRLLGGELTAPLHEAVRQGNKEEVERLIASVNSVDAEGNTPLHIACARGDQEMIKALLTGGAALAAPTRCNRNGETPYQLLADKDQAVRGAFLKTMYQAARGGAKQVDAEQFFFSLTPKEQLDSYSAVFMKSNPKLTEEMHARFNQLYKITPLCLAIVLGDLPAFEMYVKNQTYVLAGQDGTSETPLHVACRAVLQQDPAVMAQMVRQLVVNGASRIALYKNKTPLAVLIATCNHKPQQWRPLLAALLKLDERELPAEDKTSSLEEALVFLETEWRVAEENWKKSVEEDWKNCTCKTVLAGQAKQRTKDRSFLEISLLLRNEAKIMQGRGGFYVHDHLMHQAMILAEYGAEGLAFVNVRSDRTISKLLNTFHTMDVWPWIDEVVRLLVAAKAPLEIETENGVEHLMQRACTKSNWLLVTILLKYNLGVNRENRKGETPLLTTLNHMLSKPEHGVDLELFRQLAMRASTTINRRGPPPDNMTPLEKAITSNASKEIIDILLKAGANPFTTNPTHHRTAVLHLLLTNKKKALEQLKVLCNLDDHLMGTEEIKRWATVTDAGHLFMSTSTSLLEWATGLVPGTYEPHTPTEVALLLGNVGIARERLATLPSQDRKKAIKALVAKYGREVAFDILDDMTFVIDENHYNQGAVYKSFVEPPKLAEAEYLRRLKAIVGEIEASLKSGQVPLSKTDVSFTDKDVAHLKHVITTIETRGPVRENGLWTAEHKQVWHQHIREQIFFILDFYQLGEEGMDKAGVYQLLKNFTIMGPGLCVTGWEAEVIRALNIIRTVWKGKPNEVPPAFEDALMEALRVMRRGIVAAKLLLRVGVGGEGDVHDGLVFESRLNDKVGLRLETRPDPFDNVTSDEYSLPTTYARFCAHYTPSLVIKYMWERMLSAQDEFKKHLPSQDQVPLPAPEIEVWLNEQVAPKWKVEVYNSAFILEECKKRKATQSPAEVKAFLNEIGMDWRWDASTWLETEAELMEWFNATLQKEEGAGTGLTALAEKKRQARLTKLQAIRVQVEDSATTDKMGPLAKARGLYVQALCPLETLITPDDVAEAQRRDFTNHMYDPQSGVYTREAACALLKSMGVIKLAEEVPLNV